MNIKISACTIAKNEEKNIARSIESYKKYVDEIIIVDTGSTDNTVQIAESLGAKVIHFEWINDFSAAKNCALNAATGDWILFLDADEWIKDNGGEKIQTVVNRAINNGFDAISLRMLNLDDDGTLTETTSSLRLFVNKPNIRYVRKIHEHLLNSETGKALVSMRADDLILNHSGYAESVSKTKINRNKEILEKNYMSGDIEAIDYFYLARENVNFNPEYAKQFLDILLNDEEKMEGLKKLDIANNVYDLKIKLIKSLGNKYSFNEKINIVDEAIKAFPDDPAYYYFKHVILAKHGKCEDLDLIYKAFELDKTYEEKIGGNNNAFSRYKVDASYELAMEALRECNKLKAMEYLVQSIQEGQIKEELLIGLMTIIEDQDINEKVAFLNSIFDINKEEVLKFITQTLRHTKYNDVFLYYFVKYYKNFGEVDISLFTSMLINKRFEEAASKYLSVFISENSVVAEKMVVSAILLGDLKEFYEKNINLFSAQTRRILSLYFNDLEIQEVKKEDEDFIINIIHEIIFVSSKEVLEKIKKLFKFNENVLKCIIRNYYANKNYAELIEETNTFIENDLSDEFAGEITAKLGEAFYMIGEFEQSKLYFEQAIEIGYLDINVVKIFKKLVNKVEIDTLMMQKFEEYKYLVQKFIEAKANSNSEKIDDIDDKFITKNIEVLDEIIEKTVSLTDTFKNDLFDYANKLVSMNKIYAAEEYYKILIRSNYNIGKCYYNLGRIYNKTGAIELSYICYERAFRTSVEFPKSILDSEHKNKYYLYNKNPEKVTDICPVCGKVGKLISCYQYIEDEELNRSASLIVKFRKCDECSHIFAENYVEIVDNLDFVENKCGYIFNANDIKEKLHEDSKLVVIDESNLLKRVFEEDFDTVNIQGSFERATCLKELLKEISKYQDRTLIAVINNPNDPINDEREIPLWAKSGVTNVYSKQSIKKLLKDNGYEDVKIYNSKFLPGKMNVVANR